MPEPIGGKGKKAGGAAAKGGKSAGAKSDFGAEYAVSGGSTCKGCAAKIAKGTFPLLPLNIGLSFLLYTALILLHSFYSLAVFNSNPHSTFL